MRLFSSRGSRVQSQNTKLHILINPKYTLSLEAGLEWPLDQIFINTCASVGILEAKSRLPILGPVLP